MKSELTLGINPFIDYLFEWKPAIHISIKLKPRAPQTWTELHAATQI